jgi:hypothetical protein
MIEIELTTDWNQILNSFTHFMPSLEWKVLAEY